MKACMQGENRLLQIHTSFHDWAVRNWKQGDGLHFRGDVMTAIREGYHALWMLDVDAARFDRLVHGKEQVW